MQSFFCQFYYEMAFPLRQPMDIIASQYLVGYYEMIIKQTVTSYLFGL